MKLNISSFKRLFGALTSFNSLTMQPSSLFLYWATTCYWTLAKWINKSLATTVPNKLLHFQQQLKSSHLPQDKVVHHSFRDIKAQQPCHISQSNQKKVEIPVAKLLWQWVQEIIFFRRCHKFLEMPWTGKRIEPHWNLGTRLQARSHACLL